MTRNELIGEVRQRLGKDASWRIAAEVVDTVTETMADGLLRDGTLVVRHFGTFDMTRRKKMHRGNPWAGKGASQVVPEGYRVKFTASPYYKKRVKEKWVPPVEGEGNEPSGASGGSTD